MKKYFGASILLYVAIFVSYITILLRDATFLPFRHDLRSDILSAPIMLAICIAFSNTSLFHKTKMKTLMLEREHGNTDVYFDEIYSLALTATILYTYSTYPSVAVGCLHLMCLLLGNKIGYDLWRRRQTK